MCMGVLMRRSRTATRTPRRAAGLCTCGALAGREAQYMSVHGIHVRRPLTLAIALRLAHSSFQAEAVALLNRLQQLLPQLGLAVVFGEQQDTEAHAGGGQPVAVGPGALHLEG